VLYAVDPTAAATASAQSPESARKLMRRQDLPKLEVLGAVITG
jgi:hypothetical protein